MKDNDLEKKVLTKANFIKIYRFYKIYGFSRTYVKTIGRLRSKYIITLPFAIFRKNKNVGIIGCGQFSFSTIGFFLRKEKGAVIKKCFDINSKNGLSFSRYYKTVFVDNYEEILDDQKIKIVYIASNHASHTDYALAALKKGKDVYIEKPVSTSFEQFELLNKEISNNISKVSVGYNRPFSKAVNEIKKHLPNIRLPITLNCFVIGHVISKEHWYRRPQEGTRICGNLGHWLDLASHFFHLYEPPKKISVHISYSNEKENDDNLTVVLTTELSDLITITLSSREEPLEGINETINLQTGDLIAKIDDFRAVSIWKGNRYQKKKYFRKDVGHKKAILQPFSKEKRNWNEIKDSSKIMLFIAEMVKNRTEKAVLHLNQI